MLFCYYGNNFRIPAVVNKSITSQLLGHVAACQLTNKIWNLLLCDQKQLCSLIIELHTTISKVRVNLVQIYILTPTDYFIM